MPGAERQEPRGGSPMRLIAWSLAVVVVLGALAVWGVTSRAKAMSALTAESRERAIPTVSTIQPTISGAAEDIVLPGTMLASVDVPIYARTSGYLKRRYVDMGAPVKTGQLLAEIDAPELEQQLQQARADLSTADANTRLAQITADRYADLRKTDSVTQQDADNAAGTLDARKAAAESARHNVQRLEQMQAYTKIYAPFDGVITVRNTDVGALIDPGAGGGATRELFHLAATKRLRVFVNVPEVYSRSAQPGMMADLTLAEFPGRHVPGKLVRTGQSIDPVSRTLLVEIDVANPNGDLLAGSYVEVSLKLPVAASTCRLPVNALIFRSDGMRVAVVRNTNKVAMVPIMLGRDFGTEVEILSGVTSRDKVVVNPPDSLSDGQSVRIAASAGPKSEKVD